MSQQIKHVFTDNKIRIITKDGEPEKILINGVEIPGVSKFTYEPRSAITIEICGDIRFVEESKPTPQIYVNVPENTTVKELNEAMRGMVEGHGL